jgi:hypothetical protein
MIAAAAARATTAAVASAGTTVRRKRRRRLTLAGLTSGLTAKMLLGAVALAAVGGGAAAATGNLPDPIQSAVAHAAEQVGIDLPDPDDATAPAAPGDENGPADVAVEQQERVDAYTAAVDEWTACVQEKAPNPDREGPFDPVTECGDKPHPSDFDLPGNRVGPPEEPPGQSEDQGRPDEPGRPDDTGQPDNPGNSGDKGQPDNPGKDNPNKP